LGSHPRKSYHGTFKNSEKEKEEGASSPAVRFFAKLHHEREGKKERQGEIGSTAGKNWDLASEKQTSGQRRGPNGKKNDHPSPEKKENWKEIVEEEGKSATKEEKIRKPG